MQYLISQEKKKAANSPQIYLFIFILLNKKKMQYGNDIICKCKIKPVYSQ